MNVLILTPDAVGSTLLQRLVTVYMQLQSFSKPIVNLHELTNGVMKYYSHVFNQEVLGKPHDRGYYQSLPEIQELLSSVDHYYTSRLAKYHLDRRGDQIDHRVPFFKYLNDNFFIIATRRRNVFEHAMSWCINTVTKKLNVYDAGEKINTFIDFYKDPVSIDQQSLHNYLDSYKHYLSWSTQYFDISSFFCYEDHLPTIEKYILDLAIFNNQTKIGWQDTFGISFSDWNVYHHLTSDLESIAVNNKAALDKLTVTGSDQQLANAVYPALQLISEYNQVKDQSWPNIKTWQDFENLPQQIQKECVEQHNLVSITHKKIVSNYLNLLDKPSQQFLIDNRVAYNNANSAIAKMSELGILIGGLPIKKQTLAGKRAMVKNWHQCVDLYNRWIDQNPNIALPINDELEDKIINEENVLWQANKISNLGCN